MTQPYLNDSLVTDDTLFEKLNLIVNEEREKQQKWGNGTVSKDRGKNPTLQHLYVEPQHETKLPLHLRKISIPF